MSVIKLWKQFFNCGSINVLYVQLTLFPLLELTYRSTKVSYNQIIVNIERLRSGRMLEAVGGLALS